MNNVSVFNFNQNEIRTVLKDDGEIWFVASDVAKVLEYRDASNMIRNLDADESDTHNVSIRSDNGVLQDRQVTIINESGLYSATLKSRKPEAKQFKKWVTSDVLPSIRKNGGYISGQENDDPEIIMAKALQVANNVILRKTQELQQAQAERDHAITTKAEIGSRREATAMATASKFKRENEDLKQKLGESISFAAVASINTKLKTNFGNKEGRLLSKYSREHHLEIKKATVQGQRFSEVNSYHRDAWLAIFNIDLTSVFGA
ncbi:Bro-N domain-containing protein [Acinetobacter baumannii]|uniref:BRO-N domain-containing protein n=1 Tax=Acinetobacter baumannii TaxID=470 RepID=UPI000947E8E4|nr:BRO family protein [Acinetobacter baumannii]ATD20953.1 phage antirepressor protein [Acinetobacter baumannii]AXG84708.1 phage antirepressor protein [Acinetobacter baumannii]EIR6365216.1 phage antirepressor protein [Acinetobacter baumannii]EKL8016645.1 phage antirepressor protein [Acinetobacter baumannii]EKU0801801.1 phage antirepressor protein [Acinetobacter baumannii]